MYQLTETTTYCFCEKWHLIGKSTLLLEYVKMTSLAINCVIMCDSYPLEAQYFS